VPRRWRFRQLIPDETAALPARDSKLRD